MARRNGKPRSGAGRANKWLASRAAGAPGLLIALLTAITLTGCAGKQPQPVVEQVADPAEEDIATSYEIREEVQLGVELQREFIRALQHLQAREYEQGIALLVPLSEHSQAQANTAPHINLAIAYRRVEKLEQAEASLKKALEINPDHPVANNEYGMLLRRTGRFQEARSIYERLISNYPEFLPARKNLGILCDLFIDDLECALEHYSIYSEAFPDDDDMVIWIADLKNRLRVLEGM